jgi:hypothetical protein
MEVAGSEKDSENKMAAQSTPTNHIEGNNENLSFVRCESSFMDLPFDASKQC